jgi:uncharacterized DUF497 family protein
MEGAMDLRSITGFDWDTGNKRKNEKHGVSQAEVEEVFLHKPIFLVRDEQHSQSEERYLALGVSGEGRLLHIAFTLRGGRTKIRPISARPMSRKERATYEKASQENT